MSVPSQELDSNVTCHGFFVFSELRWEVIVRFVDISRIIDYHCLNFIFINLQTMSYKEELGLLILDVLVMTCVFALFDCMASKI